MFLSNSKYLDNKGNLKDGYTHNAIMIDKNLVHIGDNKAMDINSLDKINIVMEFLIKMNSDKLLEELYDYMKSQVSKYISTSETSVLEITPNQLELFDKNNISLEFFTGSPFNVDAVVVLENKKIDYKYVDSEIEVNRFVSSYNSDIIGRKGLYFLTLDFSGCLGDGIYVCDRNKSESNYLYNQFVNQRRNIMSRNSQEYLYYAIGTYEGPIKRCVWGDLEGMVVLCNPIKSRPIMSKESLELYGNLVLSSTKNTSKDEEFIGNVSRCLPNYTLRMSSVKYTINDAKG